MAGKRFLNPYFKIALCVVGMVWIGYYLIPQIQMGDYRGSQFVLRAVVFLGFAYLLVKSLMQVAGKESSAERHDS